MGVDTYNISHMECIHLFSLFNEESNWHSLISICHNDLSVRLLINLVRIENHARVWSYHQPVLSNEGKGFLFMKISLDWVRTQTWQGSTETDVQSTAQHSLSMCVQRETCMLTFIYWWHVCFTLIYCIIRERRSNILSYLIYGIEAASQPLKLTRGS